MTQHNIENPYRRIMFCPDADKFIVTGGPVTVAIVDTLDEAITTRDDLERQEAINRNLRNERNAEPKD